MAWRIHSLVGVAIVVVACGGGPVANSGSAGIDGREAANLFREGPGTAGARENPHAGPEPAAGTREQPPPGRDVPPGGTVGGGGGGGGSNCPPCDVTYTCKGTISGQTIDSTLDLKTKAGICQTDKILIACGGTYSAEDGSVNDRWQLVNGALVFHVGNDTLTCTPKTSRTTVDAGHP